MSGIVVVSLVPGISVERMGHLLGGHPLIVSMIPNARSRVGKGYNPVVYPKSLTGEMKEKIEILFFLIRNIP